MVASSRPSKVVDNGIEWVNVTTFSDETDQFIPVHRSWIRSDEIRERGNWAVCQYCGSLIKGDQVECANCGAPRPTK